MYGINEKKLNEFWKKHDKHTEERLRYLVDGQYKWITKEEFRKIYREENKK